MHSKHFPVSDWLKSPGWFFIISYYWPNGKKFANISTIIGVNCAVATIKRDEQKARQRSCFGRCWRKLFKVFRRRNFQTYNCLEIDGWQLSFEEHLLVNTKHPFFVHTKTVDSVFRALWLATQARDISIYSISREISEIWLVGVSSISLRNSTIT